MNKKTNLVGRFFQFLSRIFGCKKNQSSSRSVDQPNPNHEEK